MVCQSALPNELSLRHKDMPHICLPICYGIIVRSDVDVAIEWNLDNFRTTINLGTLSILHTAHSDVSHWSRAIETQYIIILVIYYKSEIRRQERSQLHLAVIFIALIRPIKGLVRNSNNRTIGNLYPEITFCLPHSYLNFLASSTFSLPNLIELITWSTLKLCGFALYLNSIFN